MSETGNHWAGPKILPLMGIPPRSMLSYVIIYCALCRLLHFRVPVGKVSGALEAEITKDLQMRSLVPHGDVHIALHIFLGSSSLFFFVLALCCQLLSSIQTRSIAGALCSIKLHWPAVSDSE